MRHEDFEKFFKRRSKEIENVLIHKGLGYRSDKDQLHNFKRAGELKGESPEKALWGMLVKHLVSILDVIDSIDDAHKKNEYTFFLKSNLENVQEKIGDLIVYLYLLEALITERSSQI